MKFNIVVGVAALATLAACSSDGMSTGPSMATAPAPLMDESVPQVARKACIAELARTANVPRESISITEMVYSEANSQVTLVLGMQRAPWRCLVSRSGQVAEMTSLTDEGRL